VIALHPAPAEKCDFRHDVPDDASSMVGAAVGAMVGAAVGNMVGATVGALVGALVGAAVGAKVGTRVGAEVGGTVGAPVGAEVHTATSCTEGGTPLFQIPIAWPLAIRSCGSHMAPPKSVQAWPPHHTHGSFAILMPLQVAAGRPSLLAKQVALSVTPLHPTSAAGCTGVRQA